MSMFCGYELPELIEKGLKVGEHFNMQPDCFIDYSHCNLIEIGDFVILAPRVHIIAHDASMLNFTGYTKVARVKIGNKVFIGNNAMILPGVTIGDNVIIGAGSVVTRDIPSNSVAAGNSAKVICSIESFLEKTQSKIASTPNFEIDTDPEIIRDQLEHSIGFIKVF